MNSKRDSDKYGHKQPEERTEAEGRQLRVRSTVLIFLFLVILGVFVYFLYDLQVVNGVTYRETAAYTTVQQETVDSVRGEILDSYGRVLISNTLSYQTTLDESAMGNDRNDIVSVLLELCREENVSWSDSFPVSDSAPYTFTKSDVYTYVLTRTVTDDKGNETEVSEERLTNLGALAVNYGWISSPLENERRNSAPTYLSPENLMVQMCETFGIELSEDKDGNPVITTEVRQLLGVLYELSLRSQDIVYTEYVFAEDMDITFISKVKERNLPGVTIESVASRQYNTSYAAHVLGLTGTIPEEQWESYRDLGYSYDARVGLSGVEYAFEDYLRGTSGVQEIISSDSGKTISVEWAVDEETGESLEAVAGSNVTLTLDIGLQAVVENALADHIESMDESGGAACVVVDMTGGVLAMASYPTYSLATYSQDFAELSEDPLHPYLNRATQGTYSPGSTFKLVTATAGLMEGVITPGSTIRCTGVYNYEGWPDFQPQCWYYRSYGIGHGTETLSTAIRDSCNVYFYDVGRRVGITNLDEYAAMFGLGEHTGIEIGDETGTVAGPETSERYGQTWYEGNIASAAIGQENNQFTPLQIANYIATLVNGGDHYSVHLLKSVKSSDYSETLYEYEPELLNSIDIPESDLEAMKEGMYLVTQNSAIAAYFDDLPVKVGAKTGTAQISATSTETNGLLVVFAPYDDPQIAMCIVMEKGSSGSSLASIAADILSYYFSSDAEFTAVQEENTLLR